MHKWAFSAAPPPRSWWLRVSRACAPAGSELRRLATTALSSVTGDAGYKSVPVPASRPRFPEGHLGLTFSELRERNVAVERGLRPPRRPARPCRAKATACRSDHLSALRGWQRVVAARRLRERGVGSHHLRAGPTHIRLSCRPTWAAPTSNNWQTRCSLRYRPLSTPGARAPHYRPLCNGS